MTSDGTCQVTQLTPTGRGAVASLLVSGENVSASVERFFEPVSKQSIAKFRHKRVVFGRWHSDSSHAGEEVVVCRIATDEIEIHCHGGHAAVRAIVNSLVAVGCKAVNWTELNNEAEDPIAAEARIALASAKTSRTAAILLDQLNGALRKALTTIEAQLAANQIEAAHDALRVLQARGKLGLHLTKPFRVVFAGRPNVGKSSLVNAILGYSRAIVFDQPGTTRDVLTATTALDGWPVELTDTAGLRQSDDELEQQGVVRARRIAASADLVVLVIDASQTITEKDEALMAAFPHALVIYNKCDLPSSDDSDFTPDIAVRAVTGENLPELAAMIARRIVPAPPLAGEAVPFTQRQIDKIAEICTGPSM